MPNVGQAAEKVRYRHSYNVWYTAGNREFQLSALGVSNFTKVSAIGGAVETVSGDEELFQQLDEYRDGVKIGGQSKLVTHTLFASTDSAMVNISTAGAVPGGELFFTPPDLSWTTVRLVDVVQGWSSLLSNGSVLSYAAAGADRVSTNVLTTTTGLPAGEVVTVTRATDGTYATTNSVYDWTLTPDRPRRPVYTAEITDGGTVVGSDVLIGSY